MRNLIVAGIGTDVGKTLVAAILVKKYNADYWKPVQCGNLENSDSNVIASLVAGAICHPEAYCFEAACSPHRAARLEQRVIDPQKIVLPQTSNRLIIEAAGGILTPYSIDLLQADTLCSWDFEWVLVSRHYLGSINHTLLTLAFLKARNVRVKGIIFNGAEDVDTEEAILKCSGISFLGRLEPELYVDSKTITKYADKWKIPF